VTFVLLSWTRPSHNAMQTGYSIYQQAVLKLASVEPKEWCSTSCAAQAVGSTLLMWQRQRSLQAVMQRQHAQLCTATMSLAPRASLHETTRCGSAPPTRVHAKHVCCQLAEGSPATRQCAQAVAYIHVTHNTGLHNRLRYIVQCITPTAMMSDSRLLFQVRVCLDAKSSHQSVIPTAPWRLMCSCASHMLVICVALN
jgi:phage gp46-like protein